MKSDLVVGKIRGIRIGLHYSWFLIALLFVFSLYFGFHRMFPQWAPVVAGIWALLTTFLFFVSLLLHELSHCLLAVRFGLRVREITLFALGGVSQIEGEMPSAVSELWIAIAGPLTSAGIGLVFLALTHVPGRTAAPPLTAMFLWLGYINLTLAAFNLLPGFPMDGGRVLRAFLWWRSGSLETSTRTAAAVGKFMAFTLIALGIIETFRGASLGGLWIAFVGWFLLQASHEAYMEQHLKQELQGVRVSTLMVAAPASLDGQQTVQEFVDHELLATGQRCFLVQDHGHPAGILTLNDLQRAGREEWSRTPVHAIMSPLAECRSVQPDSPLLEALKIMAEEHLTQLTVLSHGRFHGLLTQAEIVAYLQMRTELERLESGPPRRPLGGRPHGTAVSGSSDGDGVPHQRSADTPRRR